MKLFKLYTLFACLVITPILSRAQSAVVGLPSGGTSTTSGSTLLFTGTVTAAAALNVVTRNATGQSGAIFQSDYKSYQCNIPSFYNVADPGGAPLLQFSTNGGSTWDTAASYGWAQNWMLSNGTTGDVRQGAVSIGIPLFSDTVFANGPALTGLPMSLQFYIYNPLAAQPVGVKGNGIAAHGGTWIFTMGGYENTTVARNAFRIVPQQGATFTFTTSLSCYGQN